MSMAAGGVCSSADVIGLAASCFGEAARVSPDWPKC